MTSLFLLWSAVPWHRFGQSANKSAHSKAQVGVRYGLTCSTRGIGLSGAAGHNLTAEAQRFSIEHPPTIVAARNCHSLNLDLLRVTLMRHFAALT